MSLLMNMVLIVLIYLNFHVKYLLDENIYTIEKHSDKKIVPSASTAAMCTLTVTNNLVGKEPYRLFSMSINLSTIFIYLIILQNLFYKKKSYFRQVVSLPCPEII